MELERVCCRVSAASCTLSPEARSETLAKEYRARSEGVVGMFSRLRV